MRLGTRNSGNAIRPWAARRLTAAPCAGLHRSLRQAEARRDALLPTPGGSVKRMLMAREDWLIRCLKEELARRGPPTEAVTATECEPQ